MLDNIKHEHLRPAYEQMAKASALPLWEIYESLITSDPTPIGSPWIWRYQELRQLLLDAGSQISAAEAERRVLALKNPGLNRPGVAATLFAGLQLVMPGEVAPAHRHSQGAIRFVFEGNGGFTAVQGERCLMRRGDFITTPSWCWHDHMNTGSEPLIWLDGLDVPLVNFFGATFAEQNVADQQPIARSDDNSVSRWGMGLRPLKGVHTQPHSPIFSYPYERAKSALESISQSDAVDAQHGWKLVYSNPLDGGHVLPTLGAFLQKLPAGFAGLPFRSTASTVYAVVEGSGTIVIGREKFTFRENDVVVAPNWSETQISATQDTILFSFSDRAAQELLGIYREE